MGLTLLLVTLQAVSSHFTCLILFSDFTPSSIRSNLSVPASDASITYETGEYSSSFLSYLSTSSIEVVADFSYSIAAQYELDMLASSGSLVVLRSPHWSHHTSVQQCVFHFHPSLSSEAASLRALASYLNLTSFHFLTSDNSESIALADIIYDSYQALAPAFSFYTTLALDTDLSVYQSYTMKVIKTSGNWKSLIVSDAGATMKWVNSHLSSKIFKPGTVFLLSSRSAWGQYIDGTLLMVEQGLEAATSEADYELKALQRLLSAVSGKTGVAAISQHLESITENHYVDSTYSILNYQQNAPKIVGTIKGQTINLSLSISFPGNVSEVQSTLPTILISANTGLTNYDGSVAIENQIVFLELYPMMLIINNDPTLLNNFELAIYGTDCGPSLFDYDSAKECMARHQPFLGSVFLESVWDVVVMGNIGVFRDTGVNIPVISTLLRLTQLFDQSLWPELLISTPEITNMINIIPFILQAMGWDEIAVIDSVENYNENELPAFLTVCEELGISVLNDPYKKIPMSYRASQLEEYRDFFQTIIDTKVRVVVMLVLTPSPLAITESFYDMGMRSGDIIFVYTSLLSEIIDQVASFGHDRSKVIELAKGSLAFNYSKYMGEYGAQLYAQLSQMIDTSLVALTCYCIDSLLLAVHGINTCLNLGIDYEDPAVLNEYLRTQRFTGCSGTVSITSGQNGRNEITYSLYNGVYNETSERWSENIVGSYVVGITVPLVLSLDEIKWSDGTNNIPGDMREDPECGFEESDVRTNTDSRTVSIVVTGFIVLCTAGVAVYLVLKQWKVNIDMLEEKRKMYFEDGIVLYSPLIEALQYITIGPNFSGFNSVLYYIGSAVIMDMNAFVSFEGDVFWIWYYCMISLTGLWTFCCLIVFFKMYTCFHNWIVTFIHFISIKLLPLLSNIGFIPIFLVTLKIFKCDEASGDSFTDSFMENDCHTNCWEGRHLYLAMISTVLLLLYAPVAIFSRPLWGQFLDYVHVKEFPQYSIFKSILQLVLAMVNYFMKNDYEIAFSIVYTILFICASSFLYVRRPYNYARLNMWIRVIFAGINWSLVITTISILVGNAYPILFLCLQFGGWLVLAVIGFVLQFMYPEKYPSYLERVTKNNLYKLFRFMFSNQVSVKELENSELDYKDRSSHYIDESAIIDVHDSSSVNQSGISSMGFVTKFRE